MWEFNFADSGFFRFREKNFREFGFQTLLVEISFRKFHVEYLKVTKKVFVTLFATNFIEVQQSKNFAGFCWREFVFTGFNYHRSMKIREIRDN